MSHYLRIVLNLIFILVSIGLVCPFLISAPSDLAVIGGIFYLIIVMPAILYYANRNYAKNLVEKIDV